MVALPAVSLAPMQPEAQPRAMTAVVSSAARMWRARPAQRVQDQASAPLLIDRRGFGVERCNVVSGGPGTRSVTISSAGAAGRVSS
jgi:hypothetical protein